MYKRNPTIRTVRRNVYVNDGGGGSSDNAKLYALAAARPDRALETVEKEKRFIEIGRKRRPSDGCDKPCSSSYRNKRLPQADLQLLHYFSSLEMCFIEVKGT